MYVQATLVGTVVIPPEKRVTGSGKPAYNLAVSTAAAGAADADALTWPVVAYNELAAPAAQQLDYGTPVIIYGMFAASTWHDAEGTRRTTIQVRAQSIALNLARRPPETLLTLRGSVVGAPRMSTYQGAPLAELEVRTSRFRRGDAGDETDITHWPVAAGGALAERVGTWRGGEDVMVVGRARPLADPPPDMPLVEVWAEAAGEQLAPEVGPREG